MITVCPFAIQQPGPAWKTWPEPNVVAGIVEHDAGAGTLAGALTALYAESAAYERGLADAGMFLPHDPRRPPLVDTEATQPPPHRDMRVYTRVPAVVR